MRAFLIATAFGLGACVQTPPADTTQIRPPPSQWMQPAQPLPDIPKCDKAPSPIQCRAAYDAQVRAQYAGTADRQSSLQGWVKALLAKKL